MEDLTDEVHTHKEKLSEQGKQNEELLPKHSTLSSGRGYRHNTSSDEVKTLRRVKKELEQQLNASQSTTLSFQASFQAEFDLRTQIEQKLEELRERYEVYRLCSLSPFCLGAIAVYSIYKQATLYNNDSNAPP